jgi:hypothetical protein
MLNNSINVYSFLYLYNTNKPGYIETKNLDLLNIVKNDIFFYSIINAEKIVFSNSVSFEFFIKLLFLQKKYWFQRYKTHANLLQLQFTDIIQFREYLQFLFDLRGYFYFFIFPFIFKTYKISFLILYYFIKLHKNFFLYTFNNIILQLINKISQFYLNFLSTIFVFKQISFSSFFSLLNTFKK